MNLSDLSTADLKRILAEKREKIAQIELERKKYREQNKIEFFEPFDYQQRVIALLDAGKKTILFQGGNRGGKCCTVNTLVDTPSGPVSVGELYRTGKEFDVYAWNGVDRVRVKALAPFKKQGLHECYRITMKDGQWVEVADEHRLLTSVGWLSISELLRGFLPDQHRSNSDAGLSVHVLSGLRSSEIPLSYRDRYSPGCRQCGERPRSDLNSVSTAIPSRGDVQAHIQPKWHEDVPESTHTNNPCVDLNLLSSLGVLHLISDRFSEFSNYISYTISQVASRSFLELWQYCTESESLPPQDPLLYQRFLEKSSCCHPSAFYAPILLDSFNPIIGMEPIGKQEVYDFTVPIFHNYCAGGLIHHNTTLGACIIGACCLGIYPWKKKPTPWGDIPIRVRILAEDWEHHTKEVIIPKLIEWLPVGSYTTTKNNIGVEGFWSFPNGSTIEILTNSQETRLHEGWNGHMVWADEPTSREKYVANKRGLIDSAGVFLMTMTAVRETWVLDEIVRNADPAIGCVTGIKMRDNPTLDAEAIRAYEATLTEDEKLTRIEGGWLNLAGLVWGNQLSTDVNVIDDFRVPLDWPVVAMIDWHTQKPHAVAYYAINQQGIWHLIHETWLNQTAESLADDIIRCKKGDRQWRIEHAFIDPLSKGDTAYAKRMGMVVDDSFTKIAARLASAGITLDVASKDKDSGIRNVQAMLKGLNGIPLLYFFRSTVNAIAREGTIWEIQRWIYKDGEPIKENDHFCENLYRLTLTGVRYTDPQPEGSIISTGQYDPLVFGLTGSSL